MYVEGLGAWGPGCTSQNRFPLVLHELSMSSRRIIMPGGRAEPAHRLRVPMVVGAIGCVSYEGTSTVYRRKKPGM
jgi:hypothetical protein